MIQGWLGTVGQMQPIYSTPSMSVTAPVERNYTVTLGGRRFVRQAPRGHREWSMNANAATPDALATVQMFVAGNWGVGPWWWLSPWAVGTNMLTPGGSLLEHAVLAGAVAAGPVQTETGVWLPSSAIVAAGEVNAIARSKSSNVVPCPPQEQVTGSIFASQGQVLRLTFFNANNVAVGTAVTGPAVNVPRLRQISVSRVSPANTASVRVDVIGTGQVAGASVTITDRVVPWTLGDGCDQAIVESENRDIDVITEQPWANQSYTIKEVG